jgi:hypothetical protein
MRFKGIEEVYEADELRVPTDRVFESVLFNSTIDHHK